jgi:hypothetical protein
MALQNKTLKASRRMIVGLAAAMITVLASLGAAKANLDDLQLQVDGPKDL